ATLRADDKENEKLYGRAIRNREILEMGVPTPALARPLVAVLNRYSAVEANSGTAPPVVDIEPLKRPGGRIILSEAAVHFETGKSAVPRESEGSLRAVARLLRENPGWKVRVEGFTDNVGDRASNMTLSQDRANAVMTWLIDQGVDRRQLSARGF